MRGLKEKETFSSSH